MKEKTKEFFGIECTARMSRKDFRQGYSHSGKSIYSKFEKAQRKAHRHTDHHFAVARAMADAEVEAASAELLESWMFWDSLEDSYSRAIVRENIEEEERRVAEEIEEAHKEFVASLKKIGYRWNTRTRQIEPARPRIKSVKVYSSSSVKDFDWDALIANAEMVSHLAVLDQHHKLKIERIIRKAIPMDTSLWKQGDGPQYRKWDSFYYEWDPVTSKKNVIRLTLLPEHIEPQTPEPSCCDGLCENGSVTAIVGVIAACIIGAVIMIACA